MNRILQNLFEFDNNSRSGPRSRESTAYKVQDRNRNIRVGLIASNLEELVHQGKEKLKIPKSANVKIVQEDGTEVDSDDYLATLASHTVLIFLKDGETMYGAKEAIQEVLHQLSLNSRKDEQKAAIEELIESSKQNPEELSFLSKYLEQLDSKPEAELRHEHPDWFEGVSDRFKSKSEAMRNLAQQRIRSYYKSAMDQIQQEKDPSLQSTCAPVMTSVKSQLEKDKYWGCYFDRKAKRNTSFCDGDGWFECGGFFDEAYCRKRHVINPYSSKAERSTFSLWNLDHVIEKSREIVPVLLKAARELPKDKEIDFMKPYTLLFTRSNLKLVYISCHKKAAREGNLKPSAFYKS